MIFASRLLLTLVFIAWLTPASALPPYKSGDFDGDVVADASIDGIDSCVQYCITGICLILVCSLYECHIEYVPQVSHNLPDLVVSAYPEPGDMSWVEARDAYGSVAESGGNAIMRTLGAVLYGGGEEDTPTPSPHVDDGGVETRRDPDLIFKEVSAIGNPAVDETITELLHQSIGYICPTDTDGGYPYFLSELDSYSWRTNIPELLYPATWFPWARVIGTLPWQSWGRVHPRQGFLYQINGAKAAAVMSQRAVDIVTRTNQPHVYRRLKGVPPSNEKERTWQMLSPKRSDQCIVFGQNAKFGLNKQNASDGRYGFLYWARHECCANTYGVVVGVIPITPVCS